MPSRKWKAPTKASTSWQSKQRGSRGTVGNDAWKTPTKKVTLKQRTPPEFRKAIVEKESFGLFHRKQHVSRAMCSSCGGEIWWDRRINDWVHTETGRNRCPDQARKSMKGRTK